MPRAGLPHAGRAAREEALGGLLLLFLLFRAAFGLAAASVADTRAELVGIALADLAEGRRDGFAVAVVVNAKGKTFGLTEGDDGFAGIDRHVVAIFEDAAVVSRNRAVFAN